MADLRNVLSEAIRDGNPARLTRTGCVNAILPVVERFLATSRAEIERLRTRAESAEAELMKQTRTAETLRANRDQLKTKLTEADALIADLESAEVADRTRMYGVEGRVRELADQLDQDAATDEESRDEVINAIVKREGAWSGQHPDAVRLRALAETRRSIAGDIRKALAGGRTDG